MDEQLLLKKLREAFQIESKERLATIGLELVNLEKKQDVKEKKDSLENVYRDAHSLKGAARAVNLKEVEEVCQAMEGALGVMKKESLLFPPELFDLIHDAVSTLEDLISTPGEQKVAVSRDKIETLVKKLKSCHNSENKAPQPDSATAIHEPEQPTDVENIGIDEDQSASTAFPEVLSEPESVSPVPTTDAGTGSIRIATSKLDVLLRRTEELISLKLAGRQQLGDLKQTCQTLELWREKWQPAKTALHKVAKSYEGIRFPEGGAEVAPKELKKVEKFLTWSQEYMQTLNQDIQTQHRKMDQHERILERLVDDLMESVKHMLMLPSASLLDSFPRMVREMARELGKEIDFTVSGGDVEVDRRILDEMKSPLTHMLRNAVDHGIEESEERQRQGKEKIGHLTLAISQIDGDKVEIYVGDDGWGLDYAKIKKSALENKLLSAAAAKDLQGNELSDLIFESGVSTSAIITELSGRGLGMAIVREKIEKIGGLIDLESSPGKGTHIRLKLPVSLASFRGVLVRVQRHLFVIPCNQVDSVLQIPREAVKMVENRTTISYKGAPLSLADLAMSLGLAVNPKDQGYDDKIQVAVLSYGEKKVGFTVDEVVGEQEVLVKGLGEQLIRVPNLSGATILGSGRIVPILNVKDLLDNAGQLSKGPSFEAVGGKKTAALRKSILVVEDSITSRMLLKNILEAAGYMVQTANDGLDGLTVLKTLDVDLVISDIEMPRMNGFELTEKIRADHTLAHLPIVLVTGLSSREDRERGVETGANAYIIKSDFDQGHLLDVIGRVI